MNGLKHSKRVKYINLFFSFFSHECIGMNLESRLSEFRMSRISPYVFFFRGTQRVQDECDLSMYFSSKGAILLYIQLLRIFSHEQIVCIKNSEFS